MYKKLSVSLLLVWMILCIPLAKADVQDVSFRFCDDTENKDFMAGKKTIMVTPGEAKEICIDFNTNSETPRKILYGFTMAHQSAGLTVCDSDKWPDNDFSKYFTTTEERSFIIQKDQPKTIKENILLPLGMSGIQYWCLAFSLSAPEGTGIGGMFNLIINKVFPLALFVWNSTDIKNDLVLLKNTWGEYTTNTEVKANMDEENNLKLNFLVKNQWNIGQNVIITGKIQNILGFEKTFSVESNNILPGAQQEVSADVGIVPFYKGFFSVKFNVQHTPKFDFDTSNLDENMKKWWTITGSAQIYIFSWITLAIIVFLIAIIAKLFWPRKRIVVKA